MKVNFGLTGIGCEDINECVTDTSNASWLASLQDFLFGSSFPSGPCVDVAELCGGMASTSRTLVRRGYATGLNFDIVIGFDIEDINNERWLYI